MPSEDIIKSIKKSYNTLRSNLDGFEPRPHQNFMVSEVTKAICGDNANNFIVVEAGTGTGKSLGYLMSSIPVAKALEKKIVISTATVALQEQLEGKDLPAYSSLIEPVEFILAKGKSRYCCAEKLDRMVFSDEKSADQPLLDFKITESDKEVLARLADDLDSGVWSGDRDSLKKPIRTQLWETIASDSHTCKPNNVHSKCPFYKARASMNKADVIIANHNLVIADLNLGGGVILPEPEQCIYVFDEAHHLPDIIRDSTSCNFSLSASKQWLDSMIKTTKKYKKQLPGFGGNHKNLTSYKDELVGLLTQAETITRQLNFTDEVYRFKNGILPDVLMGLLGDCRQVSDHIGKYIEKARNELTECEMSSSEKDRIGTDLSFFNSRVQNIRDVLKLMMCSYSDEPCAKWIKKKDDKITMHASTLDPSQFLIPKLFDPAYACVMTSATISTLGNFDFFKLETGFPEESSFVRLGSPFDYENNAELYIPNMSEMPNTDAYTDGVVKQIEESIYSPDHKGHLILFTSYAQMNKVLDKVEDKILKKGINLGIQGRSSRNEILDEHRKTIDKGESSILMGTQGFSEGLDLVGKYLENLFIVKLPFSVPSDPIAEAYSELVRSRGGNPFMQISLPETSRKLIQSVGRLIRTKKDKGRCTILDNRIHTKRYGKDLINALPPFKQI